MPATPNPQIGDGPFYVADEGLGVRDRVTFRAVGDTPVAPADAAADLVRHVRLGAKGRSAPIRVRAHVSYSGAVTVRVYWQGGRFHTVKISSTADGHLLAGHNVAEGSALSLMLNDWLTASDHFTDVRWRTRDQ